MPNKFQKRRAPWQGLGAAAVLGGALIAAGCGNQQAETTNSAPVVAPAGSSGNEAREATGGAPNHTGSEGAPSAGAQTTRMEFQSDPAQLPAGRPATWTLRMLDPASGKPVPAFELVHDKLMHLIVVSADLSWFNHVHPDYKGEGVFTVTTTLPRAGTYKLFADYKPKGKPQEVAQHQFATGGMPPAPTSVSLTPDTMRGAWLTKRVAAKPEGQPDAAGGATYEVALMPMPARLVAGGDATLHFQVRDANGKPLKDLQPYLGALGHAVILSNDATTYLHSHPMEGGMAGMEHGDMKHGEGTGHDHDHAAAKGGGPDVLFHTTFPKAGLYKAWGQFMHKGKIITASFVLNVAEGSTEGTPGTAGEGEHGGH